MPSPLRRLEADILKIGRLYDPETKRPVRASPMGAPVNLEVEVREAAIGTEEFYERLLIAANDIINHFNIERLGEADAYVHGMGRPAIAVDYVWIPVQFYKLGKK